MTHRRVCLRFVLLAALAVMLGGAGFVFYRMYHHASPERTFKRAETAYTRGTQALDAGDGSSAVRAFEEAKLLICKTLDEVEKQAQTSHNPEELKRWAAIEGLAYRLKARVLRDHAFAQARAQGQPLPAYHDAITGKPFRNFLAIPDAAVRGEAITCLRRAALRLPALSEVQDEALRVEVMMASLQWPLIEQFSRQLLREQPDNIRALYMLARFEFEQPQKDDKGSHPKTQGPAPHSRERVLAALNHIERLKKVDGFPFWRTLHLEAQVRRRLQDDHAARGNRTEEQKQQQAREALFAEACAKAKQEAGTPPTNFWEGRSTLVVQQLALEATLEKQGSHDPEKIQQRLRGLLVFCEKVTASEAPTALRQLAVSAALTGLSQVARTPALNARQYRTHLDRVAALVEKGHQQKLATLPHYAEVAELILRGAYLTGHPSDNEERTEAERRAAVWIDRGLAGEQQAVSASPVFLRLHGLAAQIKLIHGEKRPALAPHLTALSTSGRQDRKTAALLVDGILAQREGQLERARQRLEQVAMATDGELARSAHRLLAGLYLRSDRPDRALPSLLLMERARQHPQKLSLREQLWCRAIPIKDAELTRMLLAAHLETAKHKARQALARQQEAPAVLERIRGHEEAARALMAKLARDPREAPIARQLLAQYDASMKHLGPTRRELAGRAPQLPNE